MKIKNKKYKEWDIYFPERELFLLKIGEKIIDNNFHIVKILKDTKRNYVAIIEIDQIKYILKEFRSEVIIPQRRVQTVFKDGEALTTLKNSLSAIEEGINELVSPLIAIIKRRKMIEKSYLLMEYINGENLKTKEDIDEVVKIAQKIHSLGRYHGDLNTSNFIKTRNGIKIIDTQMKKENKFFYKRGYDILTLKEDLLVLCLSYDIDENYKYKTKDIGYYIAKIIKKIKNLKVIKKIKRKKKKLREKGWKI